MKALILDSCFTAWEPLVKVKTYCFYEHHYNLRQCFERFSWNQAAFFCCFCNSCIWIYWVQSLCFWNHLLDQHCPLQLGAYEQNRLKHPSFNEISYLSCSQTLSCASVSHLMALQCWVWSPRFWVRKAVAGDISAFVNLRICSLIFPVSDSLFPHQILSNCSLLKVLQIRNSPKKMATKTASYMSF